MLTMLVPPALCSLIISFTLVVGIQFILYSLGRPRPPFDDEDDFEPDGPYCR